MSDQHKAAKNIVDKYALYAAGVGLIPLPVVDMAALTALNVRMVQDLATHYDAEFSQDWGKSVSVSLIGSLSAGYIAQKHGAVHFLRMIPLVGQALATVTMSVFGSAATYAVGQVFIRHYASGGTMLSLDLDKARDAVKEQYRKGKNAFKKAPSGEVVTV